ncbi:hypothetical protein MTR67_037998 [Solanum verrucosum]|uniref:Pistil-specific extensin-like protein n=2 Tax=Solanum TaxID=4107 RepID=A0AAF0ZP04_SOLVR|nr:pistil-specific extensin-like protein [Solanum verrucosum]KAK4730864.1 hypothetical protein R3W88_023852 [Solanum pinnatisectum]WMV44613.1 hypothetical protein MTR67_037998 [Solanum verrucosum]
MKMKIVFIASLILVFSNFIEASDGMDVMHIAGKVLCQDCTQGWNEWVDGAKAIKGSIVSLTCLDERRRVMYYGSDLTDEAGIFDLIVNQTCHGKTIKPQNCFVRLVSSPDPVCNIATDFAGGKSGVKLHRPTVVYRDLLKYVLSPFYYTTPMCDEPNINDDDNLETNDDKNQNNY